jgi:hypothetical protein
MRETIDGCCADGVVGGGAKCTGNVSEGELGEDGARSATEEGVVVVVAVGGGAATGGGRRGEGGTTVIAFWRSSFSSFSSFSSSSSSAAASSLVSSAGAGASIGRWTSAESGTFADGGVALAGTWTAIKDRMSSVKGGEEREAVRSRQSEEREEQIEQTEIWEMETMIGEIGTERVLLAERLQCASLHPLQLLLVEHFPPKKKFFF